MGILAARFDKLYTSEFSSKIFAMPKSLNLTCKRTCILLSLCFNDDGLYKLNFKRYKEREKLTKSL